MILRNSLASTGLDLDHIISVMLDSLWTIIESVITGLASITHACKDHVNLNQN